MLTFKANFCLKMEEHPGNTIFVKTYENDIWIKFHKI